jgi:hypothetical protein
MFEMFLNNLVLQSTRVTTTTTTTELSDAEAAGLLAFFAAFGLIIGIIVLVILVIYIAALWKMFTKAGQPGWAAIIPIYNTYIIQKIVGRPGWWVLLYFIPIAQIVIWVINSIDLAKSYGKDSTFGIVLNFLVPILIGIPVGFLILGFGKAEYKGPSVEQEGVAV